MIGNIGILLKNFFGMVACTQFLLVKNTNKEGGEVFKQDWPEISSKPFDHPFGPYADTFPESRHKLGPFGAIKKYKEGTNNN